MNAELSLSSGVQEEVSCDLARLVDLIWTEASGELESVLSVSVESIKPDDVTKAEGLLLSIRRLLNNSSLGTDEETKEVQQLTKEFFSNIPHVDQSDVIDTKLKLARKQDLCQVIDLSLSSPQLILQFHLLF